MATFSLASPSVDIQPFQFLVEWHNTYLWVGSKVKDNRVVAHKVEGHKKVGDSTPLGNKSVGNKAEGKPSEGQQKAEGCKKVEGNIPLGIDVDNMTVLDHNVPHVLAAHHPHRS